MSALRYPRPPELLQLGPRHNLVESSAGTGKTFLLEHLFVDYILGRGVPVDEILVVTFTEKATAELVLRLRRLLGELAELGPDHPKARQAATLGPEESWVIDACAKERLAKALLSFDRASISTIHGFCHKILREHAFVQGRFFDEDWVAEEVVLRRTFRALLRSQVGAAGPWARALRAWLGSDKSVLALENLLCDCAGPRVAEIRPRFDSDRLEEAMRAWPSRTMDQGALVERLRQHKVPANTANKCARDLAQLAWAVAEHREDALGFLGARPDLLDTLDYLAGKLAKAAASAELADLGKAVSALRAAAAPLGAAVVRMLLPLLRERAAADKRRAGTYDYADMLDLVGRALGDGSPAADALLRTLRGRYRVALIDEFQDTDDVQWSIFRRIFLDGTREHALVVIGDPKQAIYGFRGANVLAYLEAREALRAAGAGHLRLHRNYRSTADLVRVQNLLFADDAGFFRPESGVRYDTPVTSGCPDRVLDAPAPHPSTPVVVLALASDETAPRAGDLQAALQAGIVQEIRRLTDPASGLRLRGRSGGRESVRPGDIFVLTFTNGESRAIGRALGRASIPFAFYKQGFLFQSPEAEEILALLRALAEPEDRSLCARALLTRFFALDLAQASACIDAQAPGEPTLRLRAWAALAKGGDIPGLFASLVDESGILRREVFANAGERGLTNIVHVLEVLQAHWARTHATLPELAEKLAAYLRGSDKPPGHDSDLQRLETDKDAVQILTVHMAKGLEADVVFLFGGTGEPSHVPCQVFRQDGVRMLWVGKPDATVGQAAGEKADERSRVLYVACTRARYRLYLPHYPAAFARLSGPYRQANDRLEQILGPDLGKPDPLFSVKVVDGRAPDRVAAPAPTAVATLVAPELLALPTEPADLASIRSQRSGFLVTSYSAIKRARGAPKRQADGDLDAEPGRPRRAQGTDELPGGAEAGIFLHELLALVSLGELAARPALADWSSRPEVRGLLGRVARRHGRAPSEIEPAARLVHQAYTRDVRLGEVVIPGLAGTLPALREMEFHFPIPAPTHRLWSEPPRDAATPPWKIERGVVKGFVDFLCEHRGRIYLGDWKSDTLPDYSATTLDAHCRQSYQIQACIYTVAVLRFCAIATAADYDRRFGGTFFCFLRGLDGNEGGQGIHWQRPDWNTVLDWEREMLDPRFWGAAP